MIKLNSITEVPWEWHYQLSGATEDDAIAWGATHYHDNSLGRVYFKEASDEPFEPIMSREVE